MTEAFFASPILNSPYEAPSRRRALDRSGQPTGTVVAGRRRSDLTTPIYDLAGVRSKPSAKNPEGVVRHGLKKCGECRKQFTVKVGTVFEHARMPLHKMLRAVHLMASSKKGISAHQLSRVLEVQYKTAWFLAHRIREAMRSVNLAPFGSGGGASEVDKTYSTNKKGEAKRRGDGAHKMAVLALVDCDTLTLRTFAFDRVNAANVNPIVLANISREAHLMTDEDARQLETDDDPERFKAQVGKLVKQKPVEKPK